MANIDLKKVYREHYRAKDEPELVELPPRPYLMIDGAGDPNTSPVYRDAVAALYPLAYGLRRALKDASGVAYTVMPLEALWWVPDMSEFSIERKDEWQWTAMICQPDEVTAELAATVLPDVTVKKKLASGHLARVEVFDEGRAAQILHRGPYADEAPTIDRLHRFIVDGGFEFRDKHHEIYLSDPRKVAPEKNRTIIRQPVA